MKMVELNSREYLFNKRVFVLRLGKYILPLLAYCLLEEFFSYAREERSPVTYTLAPPLSPALERAREASLGVYRKLLILFRFLDLAFVPRI